MSKKTIAFIGVIVLLLAGGLYYFLRPETIPPRVSQPSPQPNDTVTFSGGHIVEQKDGKTLWEISGDQIEAGADQHTVKIINVTATIDRDNVRTVLSAPTAVYDTNSKQLTLAGPLHAENAAGATFDAGQAAYDGNSGIINAAGGVRYRNGATTLVGDTAQADARLQHVKVSGGARYRVLP